MKQKEEVVNKEFRPTQAGTFIVVVTTSFAVADFSAGDVVIRYEVSSQGSISLRAARSITLRVVRHIRSRIEDNVKYQEVEAIWEVSFLG